MACTLLVRDRLRFWGFPMKKSVALAALASAAWVSPAAAAVTVGNPAVSAAVVDTCTDCTFVLNQAFGVGGLTLSSYSLFAGRASDITPLLLTRTDAGNLATFTVVGIGQLQNAVAGVNTFAFNVAQGTDVTATNSYFGFRYTNSGVVTFDYSAASPTSGTFVGPNNFAVALGATFTDPISPQPDNSYDALNARTYSINATAVPEPATWGMLLLGMGMVGYGLRRRQSKITTRIAFA